VTLTVLVWLLLAPLVLWLWIRGFFRGPIRAIRGRDWRLMIWTGLLTFTVNYALVFWGETHISSGLAATAFDRGGRASAPGIRDPKGGQSSATGGAARVTVATTLTSGCLRNRVSRP